MNMQVFAFSLAALLSCPVVFAQAASSVYDYDWGQSQAKGQAASTSSYDWGESEVQRAYYGTNSSSGTKKARAGLTGQTRTDSDKTPPSTRDEAKLTGGPGAYGGLRAGSASGLPQPLGVSGRDAGLLGGAH
jgi:hypothetical protein